MAWLHFVSYLFGGFFLCNTIPHFVSGVMGRPFQSPFATPPFHGARDSTGGGLSGDGPVWRTPFWTLPRRQLSRGFECPLKPLMHLIESIQPFGRSARWPCLAPFYRNWTLRSSTSP